MTTTSVDDEPRPSPAADPPPRPALAPGVELIGPLQGAAFTDQQWLIQRHGQYIQVTELLYRVAEQCNGTHTLEEIAGAASNATQWVLTGDHVRQIIASKLAPIGLVDPGDGSAPPPSGPVARSPLQVSLATALLAPRTIDPITRILQILFSPPLLVPLLLVIAGAYGWLYLVRGVADTIRAALFMPGGLLLVLAVVIPSGLFHEFGHAAGLRYGGGRVRGMGVGFYLVYPTFYTDTTDAYRLDRRARLRTDLGGIYFHLLFGLGLIGLYFVTGQEVLLAVVLVISADVAYQLIPYVRLDGYWALTDLTGIPDFFSQMGPFLASVLPGRREDGAGRLPRLKRWAKIVFLLYIALTIPILALLGFFFLTGFPRLVSFTSNALQSQVRILAHVETRSDILLLFSVLAQIVLLALSLLAAVYFLYVLARQPAAALWKWSRPTGVRRVAGGALALGTVALLAMFWAPQLSLAARPVPPGVEAFEIPSRLHVDTPVQYAQTPPVGGDHRPIWQNCGFYNAPIENEYGVHALEHGAVWITYRPDLPQHEVDELQRVAHGQSYILVSPYPDLQAPVVASAWARQARLDSAHDPMLGRFIRLFRLGWQAPEPGAPCTGGVGHPLH